MDSNIETEKDHLVVEVPEVFGGGLGIIVLCARKCGSGIDIHASLFESLEKRFHLIFYQTYTTVPRLSHHHELAWCHISAICLQTPIWPAEVTEVADKAPSLAKRRNSFSPPLPLLHFWR
jgi:hypothetical protein